MFGPMEKVRGLPGPEGLRGARVAFQRFPFSQGAWPVLAGLIPDAVAVGAFFQGLGRKPANCSRAGKLAWLARLRGGRY